MKDLPFREKLFVQAAEGWLMLGDTHEANEELIHVSPEFRAHPAVLATHWHIFAKAECWDAAWHTSKLLCETVPERAEVWVCQANSLRKYKGIREAHDFLSPLAEKFPENPVIPYNLACYASQLGCLDEACQWLLRSFDKEDSLPVKIAAVYDDDLIPLWERVGRAPL